MNDMPAPHLYLVDGSGYIFRAYHALPPMTRSDGTPVNAVLGFCNMLEKLVDDLEGPDRPSHMAVIFDAGRETFRNEIYTDYKANRPAPPEDLIPQFALIKQASQAFNLPTFEMRGFEADDIIATYAAMARAQGITVTIVSSDKDLMQLVGDGVDMLDPMKARRIGPDEVVERFGVGPDKVVEVQALAGDSTDNVPGVPGIGVKTAAQLINEYGDMETLLARAEEIKQPKRRQSLIEHAEMARLSRRLVELKADVPVEETLDDLRLHDRDIERLAAFLSEQEFKGLLAKIGARAGGEAAEAMRDDPTVNTEAREYELVQTEEALERWIAAAYGNGFFAVDTETTSLDTMQAELVGVSLAIEPGAACYIPVAHVAPNGQGGLDLGDLAAEEPEQLSREHVLARLKPLLEDPGVLKIGQNLKYDIAVLRRYDIDIRPIDDTMLLSYVVDAGLHKHNMDDLSELHFGIRPISFKEVAGTGKNAITFDKVPLDKATEYAAEDADLTLRLHMALKPRLVADRMTTVYETLERPLVPVLVAMEREGIRVDPVELQRLSKDFAVRMVDLQAKVYELAGEEFNIASPKQLGEILFDKLSLPGGKKSKSGAYSTDQSVLEGLAGQGHDLPLRVLDWRQLSKLKSTYTDALQTQINPQTGRVHTSFAMASTSTGRLASTDPNLQNIPVRTEEGRKIRRAFVPRQGCTLMSADYSQIELRVLAHMADIVALKQAFHDGVDIHALTASQVFDTPIEGMDPMVRRSAKAINFGIIYGISPFGLAQNLGIPQGEAKSYIEAYFNRYPGIRDYMEKTKEFCRQHGYVTTIYGRRAHMPGINEKNPARRNFQERAAINAPIQGSAADIIRRAMIRLQPALDDAGLNARMLLQVHDELLFDVPEAEVEETKVVVARVMEGAAHLDVPLVVDTGVGENWDEAH